MNEWLIYLATGAFAGTLAGLLGVGGGLIIVPILALTFAAQGVNPEIQMHLAIGTSLATIIFTSLSSVYAHHKHGAVEWPIFRAITPGIIIGALAGAFIARAIPTLSLRTLFGLFELFVAVQMALSLKPAAHRGLPGRVGMSGAGIVIGAISALVGIGGGTLTVPFLLWCNVTIQRAIATSAAVGLPIAVGGATGFVLSGWGHHKLPEWSSGYLYWPALLGIVMASTLFAPLGATLAHRLPTVLLKRLFALLLFALALRMIVV
ncbi:MAG: sulfite exporter TauE/SafE family protein [Chromatiales bacterium]|nr:sulfite exporter TauE/SafE family protein [Chromatiales bacterium]